MRLRIFHLGSSRCRQHCLFVARATSRLWGMIALFRVLKTVVLSLGVGAALVPYMDIVALDGYNWGTSAAWSSWRRKLTGASTAAFLPQRPSAPTCWPGAVCRLFVAGRDFVARMGGKGTRSFPIVDPLAARSRQQGFHPCCRYSIWAAAKDQDRLKFPSGGLRDRWLTAPPRNWTSWASRADPSFSSHSHTVNTSHPASSSCLR